VKASSAPSRPTRADRLDRGEAQGDVRRAKLYYLRARSGKSARIREKTGAAEGETQE